MRTVMLEVDTFPGHVPGLPSQAVAAGDLLPPRLGRMKMSFDRLAVRSAAEQHIQSAPGVYALWGRMSDGDVLGLHQVHDTWRMTRVPVPPEAVRLLDLPDVMEARNELFWVEIAPNQVEILRNGERFPLWQAESPLPVRDSTSPDLSMG
ncbi:MAG: hypothetical protein IPH59_08830 [bacterium]|nr:hypothetical protein [bacterium]